MRRWMVSTMLSLVATGAFAGQGCEETVPDPDVAVKTVQMAEQTRDRLEQFDDEVVLIGRVGQDLHKYGLTYSHMGFAVRQHPKGEWSLVHKLNQCGTPDSHLFDEGMVNFFADTPFRYQAGIWRLGPSLQARLKKILLSKKAEDFEEDHYSMLAYPFSTKYQNSNGWVLEVLANALAPEDEANTRQTAQRWLKANGYAPTTLDLGLLTRLGGRVTHANISFDDHPPELRWNGHIQTVTVDSVIDWLKTQPGACRETSCPEIRVELNP